VKIRFRQFGRREFQHGAHERDDTVKDDGWQCSTVVGRGDRPTRLGEATPLRKRLPCLHS
jgi:hypothetical protein